VALIYFVCCGVSRLARFNVTTETLAAGSDSGKVAYFEGTPIPTSVVLTAVLAFAAWQDRIGEDVYGGAWELGPWEFHPLSLLFIASGSMMISKTPAYSEAVGGLTDLAREQPIGVKKALARRLGDASLI
jgi:CDP-diacylglycerol---serine O-phosphatidyltransferase